MQTNVLYLTSDEMQKTCLHHTNGVGAPLSGQVLYTHKFNTTQMARIWMSRNAPWNYHIFFWEVQAFQRYFSIVIFGNFREVFIKPCVKYGARAS